MMEEDVPYDKMQHASDVLQELDKFRKAKQNCDFTIKIGSEVIHIHQNILCANSEYFKAMLTHDTLEKQSGCVELKDLDAECVIKCADFMYGRKIKISKEKWEPLIRAADMLQLHKLRKFLADFIGSGLNVASFYKIKDFANTYNCQDLETKCDEFALENFEAISTLDGFKQLTKEYISFLLQSPHNETSGIVKIQNLLNWMKFDVSNREKYLSSMLIDFDLSQISVQHRRHLLENEPLFFESLDRHKILGSSIMDDVGAIPTDPNTGNIAAISSMTGLECSTRSIAVFDHTTRHLQCFNPANNSWKQMHRLRDDMSKANFSAISLGDYVYVLMASKAVYCLKFWDQAASWERKADMIGSHGMWPPVVTDGFFLYVAGVCSNNIGNSIKSNSIESYIPALNQWVKLTDKSIPQDAACVYLKQSIYCIGGIDIIEAGKSVAKFNLDLKEWSNVAPLLTERFYPSAVTAGDRIYVMGGDNNSTCELYDSNTNSWTKLSPMLLNRLRFKCFVIQQHIFAVGGYNQNTMKRYSIEDDEWTKVELPEQMKLNILWSVGLPSATFSQSRISSI